MTDGSITITVYAFYLLLLYVLRFTLFTIARVVFDCFWLSVPVQLIAWKDSSPNDLLCVEWDVKPYTLTHSLPLARQYTLHVHPVHLLLLIPHSVDSPVHI